MVICTPNIYTLSFTCRKPPDGFHACRMCKTSGFCEVCGPVQLVFTGKEKGEVTYIVKDKVDPPKETTDVLPTPDERIIVGTYKEGR